MENPVSFVELSDHVRSISFLDIAVATRLLGAAGVGTGVVLIVVFGSNPSSRTRHGGNMHFVYVTIPTKSTKKRAYVGDWASSTSRRRRIRPTNQRSVLIKSQIRAIESPYYVLPSVQVN